MSIDQKSNYNSTIFGFEFKNGVLIAVNSNTHSENVNKINKYLITSGKTNSERKLTQYCQSYEIREGSRISVATASKILADLLLDQYKNSDIGLLMAGYDENTGLSLYYIDNNGTRLKGPMFSIGSSSTYVYGILDTEYKYDMTVEEAVELSKQAIIHATNRDGYSEGMFNIFCITSKGWKQYM